MNNRQIISYACQTRACSNVFDNTAQRLSNTLPVDFVKFSNVLEIIPRLGDSLFHTDFIIVDIESLYSIEHADVFEILNTMSTLIKCTVYREDVGKKPIKRNTKIIAAIDENTPLSHLKEIIEFQDIAFVSVGICSAFSIFDIESCIKNCLDNGDRIPKLVHELIKNKKKENKPLSKSNIILTPRQSQIHNIVLSRGASNKTIAKMLGISESTVKLHIGAILKKYGLKSRTQLAVFSKRIMVPTEV